MQNFMDLRPLFTLSFWLNVHAPFLTNREGFVFFLILAAVVIAGVIISLSANKRKLGRYVYLTRRKISNLLLSVGIVSLVFFFFMFERVRFFGARFWFLFIFIGAVVWVAFIFRFVKKEIPALKLRDEQRKQQGRYLSSKK